MAGFSIIRYMSSLTGYVLDDSVLERIAMERGVDKVTDFADLTERDRDLLLADLLLVLFMLPSQTASFSKKHGSFSQVIGSQTITYKDDIYDMMMRLYRKWNDPKVETVEDMGGGFGWVNED